MRGSCVKNRGKEAGSEGGKKRESESESGTGGWTLATCFNREGEREGTFVREEIERASEGGWERSL